MEVCLTDHLLQMKSNQMRTDQLQMLKPVKKNVLSFIILMADTVKESEIQDSKIILVFLVASVP